MAELYSPGVSATVGGLVRDASYEHRVEIDLMELDEPYRNFVTWLLLDYDPEYLQICLEDKKFVQANGTKFSGYYNCKNDQHQVVVAAKQDTTKWVGVLVHELCHYDQWRENCKPWRTKVRGVDPWYLFNLYLSEVVELKPITLHQMTMGSLNIELDCEKRAVKKLKQYKKKFKLPIDVDAYTQNANAYIYSFHMVAYMRKWYVPGSLKLVADHFPTHFINDYTKLPTAYKKLYLEHCYKE